MLAIFLGGLGIHKFYLGYTTQGIILLLVTILGALLLSGPLITGVISLIEGIIYLTKSDEDFYNIYVANKKEWF
ncbi:MAG: TM2 domain-containing protein [Collinsella intestinalis]|uniref:TM2 domain protein n=1 Tax=Collinsella intestinalis TaxID=147207 RepID=A0A6N3ABY2_9ACTN